jgi:hypothetical protein
MTERHVEVLHPGSECCDPTTDLAGWIAAERARIRILRRWCTALAARGHRLHRACIAATARGLPDAGPLRDAAAWACGRAYAYGQIAALRLGRVDRVDRVEAAHQYRLGPDRQDEPVKGTH